VHTKVSSITEEIEASKVKAEKGVIFLSLETITQGLINVGELVRVEKIM